MKSSAVAMASSLAMLLLAVSVVYTAATDVSTETLSFVVIGDWGGIPFYPYTTLAETRIAKAMGDVGANIHSNFSVALGDNFYFTGVKDVNDARFKETFERVFTAPSLMSRWYVLAGNHDHYGNVTAQVEYTHLSNRWYFPQLYYTQTMNVGTDATLQLVMIDTVSLAGLSDMFGRNVPYQPIAAQDEVDKQLAWLEATLAASEATWLLVCGHYPVWSVGEHGPTSFMVENIKPLLEKYRVTAYLNGHDHSMQHIRPSNQSVDYFTIGAGHLTDDSTKHKDDVPAGSLRYHYAPFDIIASDGGFASFSVSAQSMVVTYYDAHGKELYHYENASPRTR
eukprot:scpid39393/ scgid10582/ Tartrate-resistant acid phosphatase type 5; Tartrate-resistant acid ATPase; Type 5 acid phosphatase